MISSRRADLLSSADRHGDRVGRREKQQDIVGCNATPGQGGRAGVGCTGDSTTPAQAAEAEFAATVRYWQLSSVRNTDCREWQLLPRQ